MYDNTRMQRLPLALAASIAGLTIGLFFIFINWLPSLGPIQLVFAQLGLLGSWLYSLATIYVAFIPAALISGFILNTLHKRNFGFAFFTCLTSSALLNQLYMFVFLASVDSGALHNILSLATSVFMTVLIVLVLNFVSKNNRSIVTIVGIVVSCISLALIPIGVQFRDTTQIKELQFNAENNRSYELYLPDYALRGYKLVQATPDSSSLLGLNSSRGSYEMTYSTHASWNTYDALYNRYTITLYNGEVLGFDAPENCAAPDDTTGIVNQCQFYYKTKQCDLYRSIYPDSYLYCKIGKTVIQLHFMPGSAIPIGNRGKQVTLEPLNPKAEEIQQIFDSLRPASPQHIQSNVQD